MKTMIFKENESYKGYEGYEIEKKRL
jgi:hypothetical protein